MRSFLTLGMNYGGFPCNAPKELVREDPKFPMTCSRAASRPVVVVNVDFGVKGLQRFKPLMPQLYIPRHLIAMQG